MVIIKINKKEPIRSFEEYLYPNYEYAFETSKEMLVGAIKLESDKEEYAAMSKKVFEYCKTKYITK